MQGAVDFFGGTAGFHDVDLTTVGPAVRVARQFAGHHPEGRPGAGAIGQLDACLHLAVGKVFTVLGPQARGSPGLALIGFANRLDVQQAILDLEVFGPFGVELQLIVTSAIAIHLGGADLFVEGVEIVAPDFCPAACALSKGSITGG